MYFIWIHTACNDVLGSTNELLEDEYYQVTFDTPMIVKRLTMTVDNIAESPYPPAYYISVEFSTGDPYTEVGVTWFYWA